MKKQNTIQICIPEPCHENWEEMTAAERGRFCGSCQKVVTDFTQMEDAEIIRYFKEGKNLCGRFNNDQLNRPLQVPFGKQRYFISNFYKKIAAGLLFGIGFLNQTFAQQKKPNSSQHQVTATKKSKSPIIISGHLLDFETQKPIPNSTIFLKNESFELQCKTNKWGGFTFSIPAKQQKDLGILNFDTTGTSSIVIEEKVLLEKSKTDLQLFCYSQADVLNLITKVAYRAPVTTKMGVFSSPEVIESAPVRNLISRKTFWQRITKPFRKKEKH